MSPLARMRLLVGTAATGVFALTGVGVFLDTDTRAGGIWLPALAFAIGAGSAIVVGALRRRPLRATDEPGLAAAFTTRVVVGVAVAELPGLLGFAGRLLSGQGWPLVIGAGWALIALRFVYPGDADVERREAEIHAAGSPLSLRRAVGAPP